jgi:hypothetical protein
MEIILFFDGDKAGKEGIKKNAEIIRKLKPGIKIPHVETPEGEDINSLSVGHSLPRQGGEKEIFTHLTGIKKRNKIFFYFHQRQVQLKRKREIIHHPPNKTCPALAGSTTQRIAK